MVAVVEDTVVGDVVDLAEVEDAVEPCMEAAGEGKEDPAAEVVEVEVVHEMRIEDVYMVAVEAAGLLVVQVVGSAFV